MYVYIYAFLDGSLVFCHHHIREQPCAHGDRCVSVSEPTWHFVASGSTYREVGETLDNHNENQKIKITYKQTP